VAAVSAVEAVRSKAILQKDRKYRQAVFYADSTTLCNGRSAIFSVFATFSACALSGRFQKVPDGSASYGRNWGRQLVGKLLFLPRAGC
jgi:hypothetical protein